MFDAGNCWFTDLAAADHPAYAGLTQANFDTFNAMGQGPAAEQTWLLRPMTTNVIASTAATTNDQLSMAAAEAKVGKGRIIASQIPATARYMKDSVATRYLHNLVAYVLSSRPYAGARALQGVKAGRRTRKYYRLERVEKTVKAAGSTWTSAPT